MTLRSATSCIVMVLGLALPMDLAAQDTEDFTLLRMDRGASAEEYDQSIRFQRIQSQLNYIDELYGEIPMDGAPRFERPEEPEPDVSGSPSEGINLAATLGLLALLLVAGLAVYFFGGSIGQRFGRDAKTPRARAVSTSTDAAELHEVQGDLVRRLAGMKDREAALVLLIENTLKAAANTQGMRISRSETARETLRRLPQGWPMLRDLRRIVMAEELVQFAGHPLSEKVFEDCLRRAEPILRSGQMAA